MYCNATAVLKIDAVYKPSKNYHQQVYVEECKHNDAGERQCNILSDNGDNRSFEVLKRTQKKAFLTQFGVVKLIMNEQDDIVRESKGVKYTWSKLYENKGRP